MPFFEHLVISRVFSTRNFSSLAVEGKQKQKWKTLNFSELFPHLANPRVKPSDLEGLFGLKEAANYGRLPPMMHGGEGRREPRGSLQPCCVGYKSLAPWKSKRGLGKVQTVLLVLTNTQRL